MLILLSYIITYTDKQCYLLIFIFLGDITMVLETLQILSGLIDKDERV